MVFSHTTFHVHYHHKMEIPHKSDANIWNCTRLSSAVCKLLARYFVSTNFRKCLERGRSLKGVYRAIEIAKGCIILLKECTCIIEHT